MPRLWGLPCHAEATSEGPRLPVGQCHRWSDAEHCVHRVGERLGEGAETAVIAGRAPCRCPVEVHHDNAGNQLIIKAMAADTSEWSSRCGPAGPNPLASQRALLVTQP
jgi:hypothetical protein